MTIPDPSLMGLGFALCLPWLVGIAGAGLLFPTGRPGRKPIIVGVGYFLGTWLATLVLRLTDLLGLPVGFTVPALILLLPGVLFAVLTHKCASAHEGPVAGQENTSNLAKLLALLLVMMIGWRLLTVLGIVIEQPLFGWDAMMNWAPKAIVWFHQGQLTDFVDPSAWLLTGSEQGHYTLGNGPAATYPEMVPLIYLWHMLGAGTWDSPLLQLPWVLAAINLGLAVYGFLRMRHVPMLVSVLGCYVLLSLPYLNVHIAIGGYADLWLACAFGIGGITLHQLEIKPSRGMTLVVLLMALMCMQLKNPGIILGLILLLGITRIWIGLSWRSELLILLATASIIAIGFGLGLNINLAGVGPVHLSMKEFQLGLFGPYDFSFRADATQPVIRSLFAMGNWHLLWYLAAIGIGWKLTGIARPQRPGTLALMLISVSILYFIVFFLSSYYYHAVSFITLNRAILYVVPGLVFWIFTLWIPQDKNVT